MLNSHVSRVSGGLSIHPVSHDSVYATNFRAVTVRMSAIAVSRCVSSCRGTALLMSWDYMDTASVFA